MAWTQHARGFFPALPPPERLPETARHLAERHQSFIAEEGKLRGQAQEKSQERQQKIRDYEAAIGEAMLAGKKPPISPIPDFDAALADLQHRSAGAMRAAAQTYAELGDLLCADKPDLIARQEARLRKEAASALSAAEAVRDRLAALSEEIAVWRWYHALHPSRPQHFAVASAESEIFSDGMGRIISALRRLGATIALPEKKQKGAA
jgi:hypothetical protein